MCIRCKLILAGLVAVLALGSMAGMASASRSLSVSGGARRGIRETERTIVLELGAIEVICASTMVKDIHSFIPKTLGALFGFVTDLRFVGCRETLGGEASARALIEAPWHIQYQSFTGILPAITSVNVKIIDAKILISLQRRTLCLYRGDLPMFKTGRTAGGALTIEHLTTPLHQIPLFRALEGSTRCPSELEFSVDYVVEPAVTLRLV